LAQPAHFSHGVASVEEKVFECLLKLRDIYLNPERLSCRTNVELQLPALTGQVAPGASQLCSNRVEIETHRLRFGRVAVDRSENLLKRLRHRPECVPDFFEHLCLSA